MKELILEKFSLAVQKYPFLWKFFSYIGADSLRIVYYHLVTEVEHPYSFDNSISPAIFKEQVKFLKSKYEIISLPEAVERVKKGDSVRNCLTITFDDGFVECSSIIAPILQDYGLTATFFLITNTIDNKDLMWRNKLLYIQNTVSDQVKMNLIDKFARSDHIDSVLKLGDEWSMNEKDDLASELWNESGLIPLDKWLDKNKPYMSKHQIEELLNNGFSIGSHSKSHPRCNLLSYEEYEEELIGSAKEIEKKFSIPVNLFSYPFGNRAKREYEESIGEKGRFDCLLGIEDNLSNINNPLYWERHCLETTDSLGMGIFLLLPLKNKIRI